MDRRRMIGGGIVATLGIAGIGAIAVGGLLVVGVVGALVVAPKLLEPKITAWVHDQLDQRLNAEVSLSGVEVSLLSSFPRVGVTISGLKVSGEGPFAGIDLVDVAEVGLGLDLLSVIKGDQIRINRISLVDPKIRVVVDKKGRTNTEIIKSSDDPAAPEPEPESDSGGSPVAGYAFRLDELTIENLSLSYDDRKARRRLQLADLDLDLQADLQGDLARVRSTSAITGLGFRQGRVTMLRDAKIDAEVALDYDLATGKATFGENRVALNAMTLAFEGMVWPKDAGTDLDVKFATGDTSFKSALSLVPSAFNDSFAGVDASGTFSVAGSASGTYTSSDALPAFDVAVKVADGRFKYPDLPTGVDRVALDLALHHPGGPQDALVIDVPLLALEAAGAPMQAQAHVEHPVSDPDLRAKAKGRIDLAALRSALPAAADAAPPSGVIDLDFDVAGRMSDFSAGNVDAVKANGSFRGREIRYVSEGWPEVLVRLVDLDLTPQTAELHALQLGWGDSDVAMAGRVDGLLPYLMTDGVLSGTMSVRSSKMDLRPFEGADDEGGADEGASKPAPEPASKGKGKGKGKQGGAAPAPAPGSDASGEPAIVPVPPNIDFRTDLDIDRLVTSSFDMTDVGGAVVIDDGAVRMDPLKATMLGGKVTLEGTYLAPTARHADVDLAITGFELDIGETLSTFETCKLIAPVLEGAKGQYNSGFTLKVGLNADGTPDLASLASSGLFAPAQAMLRPASMSALKSKLGGADGYDSVSVGGAKIQYAFENGTLDLKPFTAKIGNSTAKFSGKVGVLDRKLDLTSAVGVPTKLLKGTPLFASVKDFAGSSIDVKVRFTGTYDQPKVAVSLEGGDVVDEIVDEIKEEVGKVVDDLLAEARRQGDALVAAAEKQAAALVAEAKKQGDKLRSEAKKQGDKLVKDAKGNPIKEVAAKEASKTLVSQADKAADKVEAEAKKASDKVIAEAKAKRDQLIKEAEAKSKAALR